MTTAFVAPDWDGETVAVLATGPSMTQELADSLRGHHAIAVNNAYRLAPWADLLVALDGGDLLREAEFDGLRVSGVLDDALDAAYVGPMYERVQVAPGHEVEIRNSGLAAIRLAARAGAAKIILAGFDPEVAQQDVYPFLAHGLAHVIAQVRAAGIDVDMAAAPDGACDVVLTVDGVVTGAFKPEGSITIESSSNETAAWQSGGGSAPKRIED